MRAEHVGCPCDTEVVRLDAKTTSEDPDDDRCRVCLRRSDLSFEHLPPRGAGNDDAAWMWGLDNWLGRDPVSGRPAGRARIQQRGSGARSLCRKCNERAGERYVPELLEWTDRARAGLANASPPLDALDRELVPAYVTTTFEQVRPARFLKQVVTMLLALGSGGFAARHLDLCSFAQDPEWVGLPKRYQFYLALYAGPMARYNGGAARLREDGKGGFINDFVLELAFPPFAYVLSIDEQLPAAETVNVSGFADLGINQRADIEMTLQVGFGHTILPLDYRPRAKLDADRAENEAAA